MKPSQKLLAAIAALSLPVASHAAIHTWTGNATATWSDAANWTGGVPASDDTVFTGSTPNNSINLSAAVPIFKMEFHSGGGAPANYTFGGSTISASGSGANILVSGNVTNGATMTWNNNIQSTALNRVNPGGFSINTTSGSNATLVFNGNLFASIGTAGIISNIDFKLSNAAASGGTAVNGNITNSGLGKTGITKTGGGQGVLTLNGANTYSGHTQWSTDSGSFVLGNKSAFGSGTLRIVGSGSAGSISANTPLTGANAIANTINYLGATGTVNTTPVLSVTANSTAATLVSGTSPAVGDVFIAGGNNVGGLIPIYTRVTAVNGTSITLDTPAAVSGNTAAGQVSTAAHTASGTGTLTIAGTNAIEFSGTQNLSSVYSNSTASVRTFSITNTADTTFSGVLQQTGGNASIIKTGAGKLILSANNTYTGGTTITTGTLQLGSGGTSGALSTTGAIVNNANLTINRSNAVLQGTDFNSAAISGSGSLTLAGTGTTTLTAANSFSGGTTINSGSTLQLGNGSTTGSLSTTGAVVNNGTLIFNRSGSATQGTDFNGGAITGTGSVVQANSANHSSLGTNFLTLNAANTYSGTTTIQSGHMLVTGSILSGVAGPLGNSTTAIIIGNASTPASTSGGAGPNAVLYMQGANGTTDITLDRGIDSSAAANVAGRNDIGFIGAVGATNKLTVSGNWALSNTATRTNGLWAQRVGQTVDFTGAISGGNSAAQFRVNDFGQGVGTVRLSNAGNSYTGTTIVNDGNLLIGGNAAAGSGVLGVNSTLQVGNFSGSAAALTDGAFTVGKAVTLAAITNGNNTWTLGGNTANASSFTGNINPASLAFSPTLNLSQVSGGTVTFSGNIAANANSTNVINVAKIGAGTAVLSGTNTYDGTTMITAGSLQLGNGGTSGTASTGAITNNANLTINRSNAATQGTDFGTITSGTGSFTQAGSGTTTLNAVNSYTGGTSVTGGTLVIDGTGSINSSSGITVNGGTFKNNSSVAIAPGLLAFTSGSIGGTNLSGVDLTIGSGQTISPGNSPGTMSAGATTFADAGSYLFEVNNAGGTAGTNWDLLNATSLTLTATSGGFTVYVATLVNPTNVAGDADGFSPDVSRNFLFVDTDSSISSIAGIFTVNTAAVTNTLTGTWGIARGDTIVGGDNTQIYVTYAAIPEPSTYAAMVGLGAIGLGLYRRRRISVKAGKAA